MVCCDKSMFGGFELVCGDFVGVFWNFVLI